MVDRFFMGPGEELEYDNEAEAMDYVAATCDRLRRSFPLYRKAWAQTPFITTSPA